MKNNTIITKLMCILLVSIFAEYSNLFTAEIPQMKGATPLEYFKANHGVEEGDSILVVEVDIDNDGVKECFITTKKQDSDRSGHSWVPFVKKGKAWELPNVEMEDGSTGRGFPIIFNSEFAKVMEERVLQGCALYSPVSGAKSPVLTVIKKNKEGDLKVYRYEEKDDPIVSSLFNWLSFGFRFKSIHDIQAKVQQNN